MRALVMIGLAFSSAAGAQQVERAPSIQVVGTATVSTKPDVANLIYWVTGEGRTADEASISLATKQKAIVAGLARLLGDGTQLSSGEVSVIETRSPQCDAAGNPNNRPRLSQGACEVSGYIATLQGTGRTRAVEKAGTAAGLAARLGARDARVQSFQLSNSVEAQRQATAAAIANAREKAQAMAAGAGVRLGALIGLNDQFSPGESRVAARDISSFPEAPASLAQAVEINVSPRPIDTQARVFAQFAIAQ